MPAASPDLAAQISLVAGAARGAGRGIAVGLGAAVATVHVTGRTTTHSSSSLQRCETGDVDGTTADWGRDARKNLR